MPVRDITDKTFEDITGMTPSLASLINLFPIQLDEDGLTYILNIFRTYTIRDDVKNDVQYFDTWEASEEEWWENMSYRFYDNVDLWWVNCLLNDIINPFEEIYPGKNIKILKKDLISTVIQEILMRAEEHA